MHQVEFRLTDRGLSCDRGTPRTLTKDDWALFDDFAQRYHKLLETRGEADVLRTLGAEIATWLDGHDHWLGRLRDTNAAPVIASFRVRAQPSEDDRRFLEVPWELAAQNGQFLAEDPTIRWAPLRRLGDPLPPLVPRHEYKLGVMFVAASPYGQHVLDFEAEETAILLATRNTDMDLAVEDDGNLDAIRDAWNRAQTLDAAHLSCHGIGGKDAFLALEDEDGELAKVGLTDFAGRFDINPPRLLFLSACHSGENALQVDSLAAGLVQAGFPAVLGWAGAVADTDASRFAAAFYAEAAQTGATVVTAWASARYALMRGGKPPAHWHLARLLLGPKGGGRLAGGEALRVSADHDAGHKEIVEARGGHRIEVASRYDFVGRRREIREIRHEFRHPSHAGVLIYGQGRQGKSSLAARIMDRHPHLKQVVLFQTCDGQAILTAIKDKVSGAEPLCQAWLDRGDEDPAALRRTLTELLKGPCGAGADPILLVLDDFEALLDLPEGDGLARVKRGAAAPLAAVIRAFDDSRRGPSRLLITCRYDFICIHENRDLGGRLKKVPLPPMGQADVLKHARRKLPAAEVKQVDAAGRAARGNTGIRDMLFQAIAADPQTGAAAVASVESHFLTGDTIEDEAIRETVEGLIVDALLKPLTPGERALLQASTLFQLPLPLAVWRGHAARTGTGPCERLLGFGLWDQFPDLVDRSQMAAAINDIVASKLESVSGDAVIDDILPHLFSAWGGEVRSSTPVATDIELTRLALIADDANILDATAAYALQGLGDAGDYRAGSALAMRVLDCLERAGRDGNIFLLRSAGEIFDYAGETDGLRRVFAQAPTLTKDDSSLPASERVDRAHLRLRFAAFLNRQGDPDQALKELTAAVEVFEATGDRRSRAVTLGDIARIMTNKGDFDQALILHNERMQVYEALGDRRERAVTLGDIARIMTNKGDVDQALKLHNEKLVICEALGDRRSRAVTLGDIARIMTNKGDVDQALKLHNEKLVICEALGDRRSRAATLGDIARIMTDKGDVDQALELHNVRMQVYEALGDRRERAVTLGDIARIMNNKGDVDQALKLHNERMQVYEALGDRRSRAVTLGDIARIMTDKGDVDQALKLHNEELAIYEALGDRRSRAATLVDIARIMTDKGDVDQALKLHSEALAIYEALGDRRSRAVTLGDIARIMTNKGDVDQALKLHSEAIAIYEALGNRRSRAVTLGDIARIMTNKGDVDQALALQNERLAVNRELGDLDGIAAARFDIGQILLARAMRQEDAPAFQAAYEALAESYAICNQIGRLEGICAVGIVLAQVLAMAGQHDDAKTLAERSLDGYRRLGWPAQIAQAEALLRQLPG